MTLEVEDELSKEKKPKSKDGIIRILTKAIAGYELKVQGFTDWSKAMMELNIGACKIVLTSELSPSFDKSGIPTEIVFPKKIANARDKLLVTLLLCYPKGLTQEHLQSIVGGKTKTIRNWLTEASKGIAHHFQKAGERYAIKPDSLYWALDEFETIMKKKKKSK